MKQNILDRFKALYHKNAKIKATVDAYYAEGKITQEEYEFIIAD